MEETLLESLFREPLKLLEDIKFSAAEVDSYKQECEDLCVRLKILASCLHTVIHMVRQGNPRFCERPTRHVVDETSRTLEKCCSLIRKCKKGGFFKRVIIITITSATEFRKANASVEDAIANVKWLINSVIDEDLVGLIGMPPITNGFPNLSVIWSLLSKLQGGGPELREAAARDIALMAHASEQNGQFIIDEGGIPLLLKALHDGTLEGKVMAATTLGYLAVSQGRVRQMVQQGAITACVRALEQPTVEVQAKVAWALAEMVLRDVEIQVELGKANAIKRLVFLMLGTIDEKFSLVGSTEAASLQVLVKARLHSQSEKTGRERVENSGASSSSGFCNDGILGTCDGSEGLTDNFKHSRSSETLNHGSIDKDKPPELKKDLKVQVTRALWLLAVNNVENSRRITETRAMLGFAKLIETEQGEVQRYAIMAILQLAVAAEVDANFRKFAFRLTTPAAKATLNQLHRLILDDSVEHHLQVFCIRAVGALAKAFSAKDNKVIRALVSKLSNSDKQHLPVATEAIHALLKFTNVDNYLCEEHSLAILEVPGLPFLVQLVALDVEKSVQAPAIVLLSQLASRVGRTKIEAFQEAAALSVLKSVAPSASTLGQYAQMPIEEYIFQAIYDLEFCQAGKANLHSSHT
eukprot:c1400_g1_i1 orf=225-2141(-)